MKKPGFNSQSGKSIIELTIVLVVSAVVVTTALIRTDRAQNNIQRQNLAREFKVNLERARFDSVKRRPAANAQMGRITLTSSTAYNVFTDMNQNGVLDTTDVRNISLNSRNNVRILGTDLVFPVTISFDRRGQATVLNANGDEVAPNFVFCEGTCSLTNATSANANIITISSTGTIAMLGGGETQPNFPSPNVSTVSANTNINPWVSLPNDVPVTATPTPSPNPTLTPTLTPTPTPQTTPTPTPQTTATPTPTPTPTATPTPTPTPTPVNYCTSGQRPSQTGCTCKLPMTVKNNGKCT